MTGPVDLRASVLGAWRTNCRVTFSFIEALPRALWSQSVPQVPRRTVRTIAGHLHNSRARWLRTLGRPHGLPVPALVDLHRVAHPSSTALESHLQDRSYRELIRALDGR